MNIVSKLNSYLEKNGWLNYLMIIVLGIIIFSFLQWSNTFGDPDSFYHLKVTELIIEQGVVYDFPYLPYTVFNDYYIDHHFLYHVFLVPFVYFLPSVIGFKVAHVFLMTLVLVVFFWLLKKLETKGSFWWTLLLFYSSAFIFRLNLLKAQPLSFIILFLSLYAILKNKYFTLFSLAFIYVWTYNGWLLLPVVVILYIFANVLGRFLKEINFKKGIKEGIKKVFIIFWSEVFSRENIKLLVATFLGLFLGIIINPYFPQNLQFYWLHIFQIGLANYQHIIGVGSEWYPYDIKDLLLGLNITLIIGIFALIINVDYYKKLSVTAKYLGMLFLLFLFATIKSRRNVEYLVPIMVLFSAVSFSTVYNIGLFKSNLKNLLLRLLKIISVNRLVRVFIVLVISTGIFGGLLSVILNVKSVLVNAEKIFYLKKSSDYLKQNTNPGDIIFHSNWDDFPSLFYHNSHNYYIIGMDPTFMYKYDEVLYWKWFDITQGKRHNEAYSIIKEDFKSDYVLVSIKNEDMIFALDNNFYFKKVYNDDEAIIYQVL